MTQSSGTVKTIAILGANGRLSREVARAFHAAGWSVRAITRGGSSAALATYDGMEFAAADAMDRDQLVSATKGVDIIFNGLNPLYPDWAERVMPMAENVMAAAKANKALHLFLGNVYNFGSAMPEILTSQTTFQPDHGKARLRCQMEALFADAAQNYGIQTIILRAGDFYGGDGQGSWFDLALVAKIASGKFTYPGNSDIIHAWAYLPDLAQAFVSLAEKAATLGKFETLHFEGHNVTGRQFHVATEIAFGKKLKLKTLPGIIIKIGGWFSPMYRQVSQVFYLWNTAHKMYDPRLGGLIGAIPRTPLETAVKAALIDQGLLPENSTQFGKSGQSLAV